MKSLSEIGNDDLDRVTRRALRLASMDKISHAGATRVVAAVDRVRAIIKEVEGEHANEA